MRILMIAPQPVLSPRGTPISVVQRLTALSSLGHEVDLLTYPLGEAIAIPGVNIYRSLRVPGIRSVRPGPSWSKVVLDIFLFLKALGLLIRNRYDVIHSHEEAAFFATFLSIAFGISHVYDMHSSLPRQLLRFEVGRIQPLVRLFSRLERWTLTRADAVIAIDSDLADYVHQVSPLTPHVMIENLPIQALSNGKSQTIEVDELKSELGINGKVPIVYTGNFTAYQGLDLLIDAAELVCRESPNVLFVVVGGFPKGVEHWKRVVHDRGVGDYFKFVGTVDVHKVPAYLELAEILVSPRTDGTSIPLKIYSYMLSGKPIVATDLRSHRQVLNDEISMLVPATGPGMRDGILTLLRESDTRLRLGRRALLHASEKYGASRYVHGVAKAYEYLASVQRRSTEIGITTGT